MHWRCFYPCLLHHTDNITDLVSVFYLLPCLPHSMGRISILVNFTVPTVPPSWFIALCRWCFRPCLFYLVSSTLRGISITICFIVPILFPFLSSLLRRRYRQARRRYLHPHRSWRSAATFHVSARVSIFSLFVTLYIVVSCICMEYPEYILSLTSPTFSLSVASSTPHVYISVFVELSQHPLPSSRFLFLSTMNTFLPSPLFSFFLLFSIRDGYITRISVAIIKLL